MAKELIEKDWEKVELYLKAGAKPWNIAKSLCLSNADFKKALEERYKKGWEEIVESYDSVGTMLIEATQFQKALAGNVTMLIWLGKVRCGQREPELITTIPPAQAEIDKDHLIMQLQHQNNELSTKIEEMKEKLSQSGH